MYRNSKVLIFILSQLIFSFFLIFIYLCNMFCDSLLVRFLLLMFYNDIVLGIVVT